MSFWDVKLGELGGWLGKNFKVTEVPSYINRAVVTYRAKYVTCKNAGMRPFFHFVAIAMVMNYMIDYSHLKKHDAWRKYH